MFRYTNIHQVNFIFKIRRHCYYSGNNNCEFEGLVKSQLSIHDTALSNTLWMSTRNQPVSSPKPGGEKGKPSDSISI